MGIMELTWADIACRAEQVAREIDRQFPSAVSLTVYPIPRGGIFAAQAVQVVMRGRKRLIDLFLTSTRSSADLYIDDIVDSGKTRDNYSDKPFFALVDKHSNRDHWVVFPWERMGGEQGPEENIRRIIEYIGEDTEREGLLETPSRVVRSYAELFSGYKADPASVLKTFEDGACDEMVIVRDIDLFSCCEHHLLPFFGKAHIAYVPSGRVVGVSKVVRLLEVFSRRLQIQERLCQQVTGALDEHLNPLGSACVIEAQHLCMIARGVQKQHSMMITSSLTGVFRESGNDARREFLSMIRG